MYVASSQADSLDLISPGFEIQHYISEISATIIKN